MVGREAHNLTASRGRPHWHQRRRGRKCLLGRPLAEGREPVLEDHDVVLPSPGSRSSGPEWTDTRDTRSTEAGTCGTAGGPRSPPIHRAADHSGALHPGQGAATDGGRLRRAPCHPARRSRSAPDRRQGGSPCASRTALTSAHQTSFTRSHISTAGNTGTITAPAAVRQTSHCPVGCARTLTARSDLPGSSSSPQLWLVTTPHSCGP